MPDAVGNRDAALNVFTSAYPGPAFADAAAIQTAFYERLLPWSGGRSLLNFTSRPDGAPVDARGAFDAKTLARLQDVKAATDPRNLFRTGVTIPEPAAVS
ncbi:BBE domain-containing protein [Pseudonocardia benzenivorans]